jgi:hypothetical protein
MAYRRVVGRERRSELVDLLRRCYLTSLLPSLFVYLGGLDVVARDHADHDAGFLAGTDGVRHFGPERVLREGGKEGGREERFRSVVIYKFSTEGHDGKEKGRREGRTVMPTMASRVSSFSRSSRSRSPPPPEFFALGSITRWAKLGLCGLGEEGGGEREMINCEPMVHELKKTNTQNAKIRLSPFLPPSFPPSLPDRPQALLGQGGDVVLELLPFGGIDGHALSVGGPADVRAGGEEDLGCGRGGRREGRRGGRV